MPGQKHKKRKNICTNVYYGKDVHSVVNACTVKKKENRCALWLTMAKMCSQYKNKNKIHLAAMKKS